MVWLGSDTLNVTKQRVGGIRGLAPEKAGSCRLLWQATKIEVAVGTLIAERPPHRSRRALLTHRAPPSGRTSAHTV